MLTTLLACQGGADPDAAGRVTLSEGKKLATALTTRAERVNVLAASAVRNALVGAQELDYTLTLVADVAPPVVDGVQLQATSVAFAGSVAVVGYNVAGEVARGAVDVFLFDEERRPALVSRAIFADTDVNAVATGEGRVVLATATSDESFGTPAVVETLGLDADSNLFLGDAHRRLPLSSFAATSVATRGDRIFATSGDAGGVFVFDLNGGDAPLARADLGDARWLAVPAEGPVIAVRGTPGELVSYDPESLAVQASHPFDGAAVAQSKSTVEVLGQRAFVAGGPAGTFVIDLADGAELAHIPVANGGVVAADAVTNAVSAAGDLVFISNGAAGVAVVAADRDLGAPDPIGADPVPTFVMVGRLVFPEDDGGSVNHVTYRDGFLFVATGLRGLRIVRVDARVAARCDDGQTNGAETDVDCGGPTCGPCAVGSVCSEARDCVEGTCNLGACVDVTAPAAPVISQPGQSPVSTVAATLEVVGTCEPGATVRAEAAGIEAISAGCGDGGFTLTLSTTIDGTFQVAVRQRDAAGNVSPATSFEWIRDSALPPVPEIQVPLPAIGNVSPIVVSGRCESGLILRLTGATSAEAPCLDAGFSFELDASDGTWAYELRQVKPSNGLSSDAVAFTWTLDREAPSAPTITAPGTSPFYTPSGTLTLSGDCESGATVVLGGDDNDVAECVDGHFAFELIAGLDGSYEYTVLQRDRANNSSETTTFIVVRDGSVPSTPLFTRPAPAPHHSATSPLTLGGSCEDGLVVHLTGAATDTSVCRDGAFAFSVSADADGEYLYLVHQDNAHTEARSGSDTLVWFFDRQAPVAPTVTTPASRDVTTAASLSITGDCEPGATVELAGAASATSACDGSYSFLVQKSRDDVYDFAIAQRDLAGNFSDATSLTWTRDSTVPATPVVTSHASPYATADASIDISGTCTTGFIVTLEAAPGATDQVTCGDGAFAFRVGSTDEGTTRYVVYQTNPRTGLESGEADFLWTHDSVAPPALTLTAPSANPFVSGDDAFTLSGLCETDARVHLANAPADTEITCSDSHFQFLIAAADDATRHYTLQQTDTAGNASPPLDFAWQRTTVIPATPTIASPAGSMSVSNDPDLEIAGACEDGNTVEVDDDSTVCVSGAFAVTVSALADGTYRHIVRQRSAANGFASADAIVVQHVDRIAPAAPTLSEPSASPAYTGDATLAIRGECEADAMVLLAGAATDKIICRDGMFAFTLSAAGNGRYDYTLTQRDPAGNTSSPTSLAWVSDDTVPDSLRLTSPLTSPYVSAADSIVLAGTCTTDFTVYLQGASTQHTTCVGGAFAFPVAADVDDSFVYTLYQENDRTGVASAITRIEWQRDTVAPDEPSVTSPQSNPYWSGDDDLIIAGGCDDGSLVTLTGAANDSVTCRGGQYAFAVTRDIDTTYNFTLVQTDGAANASLPVLFQWVRDTSIPATPVITSPSTPHYSSANSITVRGTCIVDARVVLTTATASERTTTCDGTFAFTVQVATDGTYEYHVHQASHLTGIESSETSLVWIRDTTAPPMPVITAPGANPYASGDTTFALKGTCESDARVVLGGDQAASQTCVNGAFRFDLSSGVSGVHDYVVTQTDRAGNASPQRTFQWLRDTAIPPTPVLSQPSSFAFTSNGSTITIAGSCAGTNIVKVNGAASASIPCSGGAFTRTFSASSDDTYSYAVTQVSSINGSASSAANVTWTRDTVPPGVPTLNALSPQSPAANANPKATGTTAPGTTMVQLFRAEQCAGAMAATGPAATFAAAGIPVPVLPQQAMSVSARAVDAAGNVSACSVASLAYIHRAPQLVRDINVAGNGASSPAAFAQVGSRVFFRASNGVTGSELYVSDGTAAGTRLVKDINSSDSSSPTTIVDFNGVAFFAADDGEHGSELWKSDGTDAGTSLVMDINPGPAGATLASFFAAGPTLYFTADDGLSGVELWKTDGTAAGTMMVSDIEPGPVSSTPTQLKSVGNVVVFRATTTTSGVELWKTDGTAQGTTTFEINAGVAASSPNYLVNWNNAVYFAATSAAFGSELWKTDGATATRVSDLYVGTSGGTPAYLAAAGPTLFFQARRSVTNVGYELFKCTIQNGAEVIELVKDIAPGTSSNSSSPVYIVAVAPNKVIFRATTVAEGQELWGSDGTAAGTVLLADINPGVANSAMTAPIAVNGKGYFSATTKGDIELWESDSTVAGTVRRDVNPGIASSSPTTLAVFGTSLIASFQTYATGREPFLVDASGVHLLADINAIPSSSPSSVVAFQGALYFAADDGVHGKELWKSDGSEAGTQLLKDIYPGIDQSNPASLVVAGDFLYFTADDGTSGIELWRTDGTSAGTTQTGDICAGLGASTPTSLMAVGSRLVFAADDCASGIELWQVSAANAPSMVKDIYAGATGSAISQAAVLGQNIYFRASTQAAGSELWVSDGTTANTVLVKDIRSGTSSSSPAYLKAVGNRIYFSATDATTGAELWVSDGTAANTFRLGDIAPGTAASSPTNITDMGGGLVLFSATEPLLGREVYATNGVVGDVRLLKDIRVGAKSGSPGVMLLLDGRAYFQATDDSGGSELWVTDGTSAGTTRLIDVRAGGAGSGASNIKALDEHSLCFSANDGVNGTEFWRSGLTAGSTYLIQDLNVLGPGWGGAGAMLGNSMYFAANDGQRGVELWKY